MEVGVVVLGSSQHLPCVALLSAVYQRAAGGFFGAGHYSGPSASNSSYSHRSRIIGAQCHVMLSRRQIGAIRHTKA